MNKILLSTCVTALFALTTPLAAQSPRTEPTSPPTMPSTPSIGAKESVPEKVAPPDKATRPQSTQVEPGQLPAAQPTDSRRSATPETKPPRRDANDSATTNSAPRPKADAQAQDAAKRAAGKNDAAGQAAAAAQQGGGNVTLNTEQRTKVRSVFAKRKGPRVANVSFPIQVGTIVPKTVTLVAVPQAVVVIVPQYRRYRYFVANNQVCVVDPTTLAIIDIIPMA